MKSTFTLASFSAAALSQQTLFNPHLHHNEQNGFGTLQVKEDGVEKTLYLTPQCGTNGG